MTAKANLLRTLAMLAAAARVYTRGGGAPGGRRPEGGRPGRHRLLTAVLALLAAGAAVAIAILAAPATAVDEPPIVAVLKPGQDHFWDGPAFKGDPEVTPTTDIPPECASSGGSEYGLTLEPGSTDRDLRLRVALDSLLPGPARDNFVRPYADGRPGAGNKFRLELTDPHGKCVSRENLSAIGLGHGYSIELDIANPKGGTWEVRVVPVEVKDFSFRLRAKLEKVFAPPDEPRVLKPNLRIIPPFEITFRTPTVTYGPGSTGTAGVPLGCMAEEVEERLFAGQGAISGRCLRFSAGVENVGKGPLVIQGEPELIVGFPPGEVPARQRLYVYEPDEGEPVPPTYQDEPSGSAGKFVFHPTHAHNHYEGIYSYELFEVTDAQAGKLEPAGEGQKRGFEPGDERLADWGRFYQCPQVLSSLNARAPAPCSYRNDDGFTLLGTGWGDIYEWNRGGQYADFPADPDDPTAPKPGRYVIRGTTDSLGKLIESKEHDNVSYTYIEVKWDPVAGEKITILERGYGRDPWDPQKVVLTTLP